MFGKDKSHGVRFELISVFGLENVDQWNPRSCPMQFMGFSNHEKGAPRQET